MLDITMAEILKSQSQVDLTPTQVREIAGWAFSRTITKLEDKKFLCSLSQLSSVVGFTTANGVKVQKWGS